MAMRSLRAPGIVTIRLTIAIWPIGVLATNGCCDTGMPAVLSWLMMYSRVRAIPGDPAGRGPMLTISRRWSYARAESNAIALWALGCGLWAWGEEPHAAASKLAAARTRSAEPEPGSWNP